MYPLGVTGCYVPVVIVVNGVTSNFATVAVTNSGMYCADSQTFLPGELESAVEAGVGRFAFAEMTRFRGTLTTPEGPQEVSVDNFEAKFFGLAAANLPMLESPRDFGSPLGSCRVLMGRIESGHQDPTPIDDIVSQGSALSLEGLAGETSIPLQDNRRYEASVGGGFGGDALPEFYLPGFFNLRGFSGGDDSGVLTGFETGVTLPDGFAWLNASSFSTVGRDRGLTVQWSGADSATEFVAIEIQSVNHSLGVATIVYCTAHAESESFTIPQWVMRTMPASSPWNGEGDPNAIIVVATETLNSQGKIQAGGLTGGRFYYSNRKVRTIDVE